jgi:SAM-dependent methyltransferase
MFAYALPKLCEAERLAAANASLDSLLQRLRQLPLPDFGELMWSLPTAKFPALSDLLPPMASLEVQDAWTGTHGIPLLTQTLNFARLVDYWFLRHGRRAFCDQRVLDFGCGYGRVARLMYYYTSPENFYALDPWDEAIALCHQAHLPGTFLLSDYLPSDLPVEGEFDLIYAFSVFTHLSERAAHVALETLRRYVRPNGFLVVTIRPLEFWSAASQPPIMEAAELEAQHCSRGFAFRPHLRAAVDGDVTYGDTSMTSEYIKQICPAWHIVSSDRLDDPYQLVVLLEPV